MIDDTLSLIKIKDDTIKMQNEHIVIQDEMIAHLDNLVKKLQEDNAFLTRKLEKFNVAEEQIIAHEDMLFTKAVFRNVV
jgi:hypothetical protein